MAEFKKKPQRRQMVQGAQREFLFEAMKDLLSRNKKEVVHKKQIWENIANELNKLGPIKEPARWRKCWSDLLLRLRKRILQQQEKYQIKSLNEKNIYKKLKLSADDIKILNCYGGIELLFKDCNRKTKDGKMETISIAGSSENTDFIYDQDDTQMSIPYNVFNKTSHYDTSTPKESNDAILKIDIPEIYNNTNSKSINRDEIYKNSSRIIHDQLILESMDASNSINNNVTPNQELSSSFSINNEMIQSVSFVDHIKESLEIQKQTFEEIRRLGVIQQDTNNLIRILISRLTPSTLNTNENYETAENRILEENHLSMVSVKLEEINQNESI